MFRLFLKLILLLNVCFVYGFGLFGFENGFTYMTRKMSAGGFSSSNLGSVETRWIEQPLDHFDSKETRTWQMRYFDFLDYFRPGGPIILFIGGENEASPSLFSSEIFYELAYETKGAMFMSEHRYYGKSMPLNPTVTEDLKYLSSRQAIADLVFLLKYIKSSPNFKYSKVVVIGGSYAGNLAAWSRLLYPDMIDAAIASSAPVMAKKDFYEYLEKVADDYKHYGTPGCLDKIAEIFNRYDTLLKTEKGIEELKAEVNICPGIDMTKPENQNVFFLMMVSMFMINTQFGSPSSIARHCEQLTYSPRGVFPTKQFTDDDMSSFWSEGKCLPCDFDRLINKNDHSAQNLAHLSWTYQMCTEFGYFLTTTSDAQPFTKNITPELYYAICSNLFGSEFNEERVDEGVKSTNEFYGGLKPNVTNVVFVNGEIDPWSRLGVLENISDDAPAKVISNEHHCSDIISAKPEDSEELKEARKYEKDLIKKWLGLEDTNINNLPNN